MSEWISVKDRMPEIDGFLVHSKQVLVATDNGIVFGAQYHKNECFYPDLHFREFPIATIRPTHYGDCEGMAKATHWMPLPEPPK